MSTAILPLATFGSPLLVKKLDSDAILPSVAHPGDDLGFDLYAIEDTVLAPGRVTRVRTGVAVAMQGFGFRIADRSSMALRSVRTSGGVIDAGYTGEMFANLTYTRSWYACLWNWICGDGYGYYVHRGDKVAQFIPQPVFTSCVMIEVYDLPESQRGEKGYGSTGR